MNKDRAIANRILNTQASDIDVNVGGRCGTIIDTVEKLVCYGCIESESDESSGQFFYSNTYDV